MKACAAFCSNLRINTILRRRSTLSEGVRVGNIAGELPGFSFERTFFAPDDAMLFWLLFLIQPVVAGIRIKLLCHASPAFQFLLQNFLTPSPAKSSGISSLPQRQLFGIA
jgi:hypothetical protein